MVDPFSAAGPSLLGARPVRLDGPEELRKKDRDTPVDLVVEGPAALLDADGAPVAGLTLGDLPWSGFLRADAPGEVLVEARAGDCAVATLDAVVADRWRLAGRGRDAAPGFGPDDAFGLGTPLDARLELPAAPEREGETGDWHLVPHRDAAGWLADPSLADLTGAVEAGEVGAVTTVWGAVRPVGAADSPFGQAVDLVLDLDRDGRLSPGDALDRGADGGGLRLVGDFGQAGAHRVATRDVSGGDWLAERVWWPEDLQDPGQVPLVVISHGNGHEYTWYDYLGEHLASWGYVVMAHENETQPGIETASQTTLTNTDWLLSHLAEVDAALVGHVDPTRLAWIGHSRGGEGVVRAYTRLREGDYEPLAFDVEAVRVILSIAPTVFNEVDVSDPYDVRYHLFVGTADGDVTGGPEAGPAQSFRLWQAAEGTASSTSFYGAEHNDFNCCGIHDGSGRDQLEREDLQPMAKAYTLAVLRESLEDDPYARLALSRDPTRVPATPLVARVVNTWRPAERLVIDDFQENPDPARASSGAPVDADVDELFEGALDDGDSTLTWVVDDPMNGMTQAEGEEDEARGVVFSFEAPAFYGWELPGGTRDWSAARTLDLLACQGTRNPLTVELDDELGFAVTLVDGQGREVRRVVDGAGRIPPPYERRGDGEGTGWSNAFTSLRVPLDEFRTDGSALDLSDIASVRLEFAGEDGSPLGRVGLDDVAVEP